MTIINRCPVSQLCENISNGTKNSKQNKNERKNPFPSRDLIQRIMPFLFSFFTNLRIILQCTEIFTQQYNRNRSFSPCPSDGTLNGAPCQDNNPLTHKEDSWGPPGQIQNFKTDHFWLIVATVIWLNCCPYGVKQYPFNQSTISSIRISHTLWSYPIWCFLYFRELWFGGLNVLLEEGDVVMAHLDLTSMD